MRVLTNFVRTAVPALLGLLLAPTAVLAQVSDCPVEPAPNVSIASGNVFAGPNCVLYTQGDVDSFVFSANSGDTYRLAASEVNEVCDQDIALALYDPNQVRIFTSPTNSCEGAYSIVTNQTLTTTGNYTMVVTLAGYGPGTRTYGVSLERLSPIPPNAQQITLAQVAAGDITPLTDSNAFTWTGVTTCTYQVTATMTPGGCRNDLCMNVYFPDGTSTATQCTNSCESQYTILLSLQGARGRPTNGAGVQQQQQCFQLYPGCLVPGRRLCRHLRYKSQLGGGGRAGFQPNGQRVGLSLRRIGAVERHRIEHRLCEWKPVGRGRAEQSDCRTRPCQRGGGEPRRS
jgi:hypothetical protein